MLKNATTELQALIYQVMCDCTLCFDCRSAAVGTFALNFYMNDFPLEKMPFLADQLSWKTACKTVRSFEYPSRAACGAGAKAHVDLKEIVSRCLDKCEKAPMDLEFNCVHA